MNDQTSIEYADFTFNPWIGCAKVGPGCDNCYAAVSYCAKMLRVKWGAAERRHLTAESTWKKPEQWNRKAQERGTRYRVLCASLADIFDNDAPQVWRERLFKLIRATPFLDWIFVTKRIGNAPKMLPLDWGRGYPNVWIMISVVNQKEADRDIPKLRMIPAAIRALSVEPMLSRVDPDLKKIDWVVCGAESGKNRRPFDEISACFLQKKCTAEGVAFFGKQGIKNGKVVPLPVLNGKVWEEYPETFPINYN